MNSSMRLPGTVVAAAVMLGLLAASGIAMTGWAVYQVLTATGMGGLLAPIFILFGAIGLTGGVGCAVLVPRIFLGTHRRAATAFAATLLVPAFFLAWLASVGLLEGLLYSQSESFFTVLLALPLVVPVAALVLLWVPRSSKAFFSQQHTD